MHWHWRQGSHLACDIHRPAAPGRFPAIVDDFNAYHQLEALGEAAAYFVTRRRTWPWSCRTWHRTARPPASRRAG